MDIMYILGLFLLCCILISIGFITKALERRLSSYGMTSLVSWLERLLNFKVRRLINAALHVAVRRSHPLAVEFLLRLQADCTTRNSDGDTALLAAIRKNNQEHLLEIVRLLLTRSNPVHYDRDGNTAHHLAVGLVDRFDIFEEILRHST